MNSEFNARFSAIKRYYKYRILCRAAPPGLDKGKVWHCRKNLNIKSMEDYKYLMGELSAIRSLQQDLRETLQMDDNDG